MQDFVFFVGRFHVLALHLPIGLVFAAIAADWLSQRERWQTLRGAVPFLWGATALSAVFTVLLGYMHFAEGGFTGPSASRHRLYGTLVAIACVAVWWTSAMLPALHRRLNVLAGLVVLALVTMTGHYGGNLTHGSDYLVAYAPQALRSFAGLEARRPPVRELASADPWLDVVHPILDARCASCHNDDKRNGEFSVASYESTLAGGETGSAVVPGRAELSELLRRVSLPDDDDAFMPAEGKTPLTPDQVEILRWWIEAGAPMETTLASVPTPPEIEPLLRRAVGLDAAVAATAGTAAQAAKADPAVVDALFAAGFLARQRSLSDPRLTVSVYSVGSPVGAEQLAALRRAADVIVELDLQNAGLEDADLRDFSVFGALESLRLSRNSLTDAGVAELASLPSLAVLNLYGNAAVTDAALESLAAIPSLESAYLWSTGVTAEGVAGLLNIRPDLEVQLAAEPLLVTKEDASARQGTP